ncbi:MAG: nitrogen regulation protein NR(II) [Oligoflexales bacterium]
MQKKADADSTIRFVEDLKRRWMETVDALIDPLVIVDNDYKISKANKALAKLVKEDDVPKVIGKTCYKVFAGRKTPCPGCKMKEAWTSKKPQTYVLENIRNDRYVEVTSQPIFNRDGEVEGTVQVYRDRTEAKQMQDKLLQSEKLASIGLLAGGIAHEINNPLGGILIFSQMLLRELDKNSSHYQDVVEIENATQRCKQIVESLLDFARSQPTTTPQAQNEDVDVAETILSALKFAKVGHRSSEVVINERWSDVPLWAKANRNKLIQLFLNLVQNAYQAMPSGGTLTLESSRVQRQGTWFGLFKIADSGVGIPKSHLKKIFDPFYTTKGPGEGTGLGLSICHGIIQELGGSIDVQSQPNKGTTFTVNIPVMESHFEKQAS